MKKLKLIGVLLLVVMGCKSLTPVATTNAIDTRLRPREVQQQIEDNALRFESLQWRGQASLEREGKRQKVGVTLRLKQGEGIWVSGSVIVPLARVLITPKQLQLLFQQGNGVFCGFCHFLPVGFTKGINGS